MVTGSRELLTIVLLESSHAARGFRLLFVYIRALLLLQEGARAVFKAVNMMCCREKTNRIDL